MELQYDKLAEDLRKCHTAANGSILTAAFRVSFPHVFEATVAQGADKAKYSISSLFPPTADIALLKQAAAAAVREKWGADVPARMKNPFLKAEDYEYEGYEQGWVLIRSSSLQKPGLIDQVKKPIITSADFYPGCWARATLRAFTYDTSGNKGVSFGLQNIQKVADDESMGGRSKPEEDFGAVDGGAGVVGTADDLFT